MRFISRLRKHWRSRLWLGWDVLWSIVAIVSLVPVSVTLASPVSTDFDADGTSDLTYIQILGDASGTLRWHAVLSSTGESTMLSDLGKVGDHISVGNLRGTGPVLGVVRANTETNSISWIAQSGSSTDQVGLGLASDSVVAGADFDGSGADDIAALEKRSGALVWKIRRDPFAGGDSSTLEVSFGRGKSKYFFASPDGTQDWLGIVKKRAGRQFLYLKNAISGQQRKSKLKKGARNLSRKIIPVSNANGVDVLMSSKVSAGASTLRFVGLNGRLIARATLQASGDIVVGDFDSSLAGEEVAVQSGSTVYLYNPFSQTATTRTVPLQNLIAVDEININSFSSSDNGNGGGGDNGPTSCEFADANDGSGGFLWKPNSDTQFYAVTLLPGKLYGKAQSVETYTQSGTLIKELTAKGCANPDADGLRCAFQDFSLTGKDYKNQYGSIIVQANLKSGGCYKYLISNPANRVD